jgi:hypothetical protein
MTTAATVACHVLAVLGLWVRLRSQEKRDAALRRLLVDVVHAILRGGQAREQRADGATLTVTLAVAPGTGEQGNKDG